MVDMKMGVFVVSALIVGAIPSLSYGIEPDGPSEDCRPGACKTKYGQLERVEKKDAITSIAIHPVWYQN